MAAQKLVTLNAPCFEIPKMWSAVFVPSELTKILRNLTKMTNSGKTNSGKTNSEKTYSGKTNSGKTNS